MTAMEDVPELEKDIVFECPHCAMNLVIDRVGMGLTIECPSCLIPIRVPTMSDLGGEDDRSEPTRAPVSIAQSLNESQEMVKQLTKQVTDLSSKQGTLEKSNEQQQSQITRIRKEFGNIQAALDRIAMVLTED